jgi:hypothetical protein
LISHRRGPGADLGALADDGTRFGAHVDDEIRFGVLELEAI